MVPSVTVNFFLGHPVYILSSSVKCWVRSESFTRRAGSWKTESLQVSDGLAVHLARHLGVGGTVGELGASRHEGQDGFAVNEEELPPVTCREHLNITVRQLDSQSLRT